MISITKRETKGLTHTGTRTRMNIRENVKTSQAQARIMSRYCRQLWLLKVFVAFVALRQWPILADTAATVAATAAAQTKANHLPIAAGAAAAAAAISTRLTTMPKTIDSRTASTVTNTTTTTTIAMGMAMANSQMADLASGAYEALKPTENIATKAIERPTEAYTFAVLINSSVIGKGKGKGNGNENGNSDVDGDGGIIIGNDGNNANEHWKSARKLNGNVTAGFQETLTNPLEKVMETHPHNLDENDAIAPADSIPAIPITTRTQIMSSLMNNVSGGGDGDGGGAEVSGPAGGEAVGHIEESTDSVELNMSFHDFCMANRDSFADLLTIVLYSIVCIVGLFGNTLVIYVVLRFSKMQTVTNIYILNLAIADECFLIGIPFLLYTMRICSWTFGQYMCKAYMVSTSITQFTSSIFLLIMSADRFIAVCHPIASPRYRTIRIAKLVSAIAWLTSAVLMLPVILFASTIAQEDGVHSSCNIEWPEAYNKHTGTTFILYTFFLGFGIPLCFILCFYYLVIRKLHAVGRKHKSKEKKRSHRKVTRLVLTVITVYVLCWLPQWISQVALINSSPGQNELSRFEVLLFLLFGCMAYSNSAMNPILYAFLSDNFRKSFFKAFTCMAGHEVNAQLQVEPSVFTKHGGSRRRGGSKRSVAQTTTPKSKAKAKSTLIPGTPANNNSSTATSSTTTQADKHNVSVTVAVAVGPTNAAHTTHTMLTTAKFAAAMQLNDSLISEQSKRNGLVNTEDVILVLDKQQSICATLVERGGSNEICGIGGTLQTDV